MISLTPNPKTARRVLLATAVLCWLCQIGVAASVAHYGYWYWQWRAGNNHDCGLGIGFLHVFTLVFSEVVLLLQIAMGSLQGFIYRSASPPLGRWVREHAQLVWGPHIVGALLLVFEIVTVFGGIAPS